MSDQQQQHNFKQNLLNEHNKLRAQYGNVKPLELDTDLSLRAQSHADSLAERRSKLENSSDETVGENLYYLESEDGSYEAEHIIDYWLRKSNIDSKEKPKKTNHFTQIVWKNSHKLGVGVSSSDNGGLYVVAFYYPRGNILNFIDENVLTGLIENGGEHTDSSELNELLANSHEHKENCEKHKDKKHDEKLHHVFEKFVKKVDKERTGKISLTKAKKVFHLINEKFGTNLTNMDAKKFFEKFKNLDENGKVGQKEFRRALHDLNLKL